MSFNFNKTVVSSAVQDKILINRIPDWMQNSLQIQKFFDSAIQPWFNVESSKVVDGYIGERGTPAALGKIFIDEDDLIRRTYQLSPAYVSYNASKDISSIQFFPDLVNYMSYNGALTDNQDRLLSGSYYSWDPPINKNKMVNYSNYYWDMNNSWKITTPDYVVMQRGAMNGNLWSTQNFWYTVGDTLEDGTTMTAELVGLTSRFNQAKAPIIEYYKDIEMLNYGALYRTDVTYLEDTYTPEDFMLKRVGDGSKSDGVLIKSGDTILFTSIGNPGENNRIYRVNGTVLSDGTIQLGLVLLESQITRDRPTGEPHTGDVITIRAGKTHGGISVYWNGAKWVATQTKSGINTPPLFVLYDLDGVRLDDATKYPGSNFAGNSIFYFSIDYDYNYSSVYTNNVALSSNNYYVFDTTISSVVYTYKLDDVVTEINGMYLYNVITEVVDKYKLTVNDVTFRSYTDLSDSGMVISGTCDPSKPLSVTVYDTTGYQINSGVASTILYPSSVNKLTVNTTTGEWDLVIGDMKVMHESYDRYYTYAISVSDGSTSTSAVLNKIQNIHAQVNAQVNPYVLSVNPVTYRSYGFSDCGLQITGACDPASASSLVITVSDPNNTMGTVRPDVVNQFTNIVTPCVLYPNAINKLNVDVNGNWVLTIGYQKIFDEYSTDWCNYEIDVSDGVSKASAVLSKRSAPKISGFNISNSGS